MLGRQPLQRRQPRHGHGQRSLLAELWVQLTLGIDVQLGSGLPRRRLATIQRDQPTIGQPQQRQAAAAQSRVVAVDHAQHQ